jgi:hypothetical protein
VRPNGVQVTIPFKGFPGVDATPQCPVAETNPQHTILPPYDCPSQAMSKAFFVGWDGPVQRIPADIELTLKKVTVFHSLDDPQPGDTSTQAPPGEYGINMDANGLWAYLNDFAPGLDQVNSGDSFDINRSFRLRVKDGGRLRLFFPARECDLPHMNPCFATTEVAEDNDGPGDAKVVYPTVADAVGDHVIKGGDPKDPNWQLTYSVRQVSPATVADASTAGLPGGLIGAATSLTYPNAGAPGSGGAGSNDAGKMPRAGVLGSCADTSTPRSSFRPIHVTRRGLSLRGRARDVGCHGRAARVTRVEVAIARRVGGRCSFLLARGDFGRAVACTPQAFQSARGTASWRFSRHMRLARGSYIVFSRAIDRAGNVEYRGRASNRARFSVR